MRYWVPTRLQVNDPQYNKGPACAARQKISSSSKLIAVASIAGRFQASQRFTLDADRAVHADRPWTASIPTADEALREEFMKGGFAAQEKPYAEVGSF